MDTCSFPVTRPTGLDVQRRLCQFDSSHRTRIILSSVGRCVCALMGRISPDISRSSGPLGQQPRISFHSNLPRASFSLATSVVQSSSSTRRIYSQSSAPPSHPPGRAISEPANPDRRRERHPKPMALLAPSPRALFAREATAAAASSAHPQASAACSTVGGAAAAGRGLLWMWRGKGRRARCERVRAGAYFWDVAKPVELEEIDSMEKLDEALGLSIEHKEPILIDWY
jgi:hypothetical protein